MILGMTIATFLRLHVTLSLVGIVSGLAIVPAMLRGRFPAGASAIFLATTILTSATGFPLPPYGFDPPRVVGTLSLVLLALSVAGLYVFRLAGAWRWIYISTALAALYLNCFVAVIQSFQKIPAVNALAPTQTEPPFLIAQVVVLAAFIAIGVVAIRRKNPGA
jgi:hypothetical protein